MSSSVAPARPAGFDQLLADFDAGKSAALARVVSIVENHRPGFDEILGRLHTKLGRARRIGITGPPGAGKSTLGTLLVRELRSAGHRVGVVAVDPTSPFTGGALLGDRVRMESVALDSGVFIRSMATRGSLGGLAAATREVADVLDAFGFERIIVETVGVGQSELDIARIADSSVVVLVPESGDSIQTLKAGLMEIADIFVVNKADRPGADRLRMDIELMLGLRSGATMKNMPAHHGVDMKAINPARAARQAAKAQLANAAVSQQPITNSQQQSASWTPPVLSTIATRAEGVGELLSAIDAHFAYLEESGGLRDRRRRRLRDRVVDVVEQRVRSRLWTDSATQRWLDGRVEEMESGSATPFTVADELLEQSAELIAHRDKRAST
ncbi:MAG: methylmalonyl Co-A mutase-associated GTPase MeaB [Gemmatimonadaceae bacterium]|nr:methylmalonyl Co-A mutase-associated GTPase MeaB [Gemmatimonadaceae bacterium]